MAIPDYFGRNALAVAQVISGLDEQRLEQVLGSVTVGITLGTDAKKAEGLACADLLVRLVARLYPRVVMKAGRANALVDDLSALARRINPSIELGGNPTVELVVGSAGIKGASTPRIFIGSDGWQAKVSTKEPQSCGATAIPFGPGIAACLGAANLFRNCFLPSPVLDEDVSFSPLADGELMEFRRGLGGSIGRTALIGAGAIGNAAAWALSRTSLGGTLDIVDHESVDLGNLQRYVLIERSQINHAKSPLLAGHFVGHLKAVPIVADLGSYLEAHGYARDRMLLALDSARDRRAAQASLPRWIANAWTQPGDLGVSVHDFLGGACVSCLYLPDKPTMSEDVVIATALGLTDRLMDVRALLYNGGGTPRPLLDAISTARGIEIDRLLPFEGWPLRSLYVEGFCGGGVVPIDRLGSPRAEVHVPLAHQSALAGVLLATAVARHALGGATGTHITQLDVLRPVPQFPTKAAAKHAAAVCICQDPDFRLAYEAKYGGSIR